ncbi:SH3 domain-containing protein [Devosia faecipullorum]|uniref:SH3 domain-containing protein n=1 Tax=Devosia faecipullorum TaxID=2755039 RepID=UPI00187B2EC0|nr:hypothetical protein [Devosia faecipullorum]MBE7734085.1 hypothetical protein [Devosia faecipullorum]
MGCEAGADVRQIPQAEGARHGELACVRHARRWRRADRMKQSKERKTMLKALKSALVAYGQRPDGDCRDIETLIEPGGSSGHVSSACGGRMGMTHIFKAALVAMAFCIAVPAAHAEIDGHGPDAWRVTNVTVGDVLNARMGPGTNYPVIETFSDDERGLQQITCVPFYTAAHYSMMTQAQIQALPPRWCLMRDADMRKAGWVSQRYITPDNEPLFVSVADQSGEHPPQPYAPDPDIDPIAQAQDLVREVYERQFQSENSNLPSAFDPAISKNYFTDDIVAWLGSGNIGAHPLYGAQDFDGAIEDPMPDPYQPMLRGMITINVDFTNFGRQQRAVFLLRADTTKPGAPLRIFRVEHDGWSYP